mgnify:CR=1 FL=1
MAGGMRRSATMKKLTDKQREPVETCATYLKNKAPYLKYDRYLDLGFPIATGVIEGACRHLVKDRMDITGAKWRLTSAEVVLRLRACEAVRILMNTGIFMKPVNTNGIIRLFIKTVKSRPQSFHNLRPDEITLE